MKQVIVIRKDLGMRWGKAISQGAHASLGAYLESKTSKKCEWLKQNQAKITVRVDSEEELLSIHKQAQKAGLVSCLIQDAGKTEFKQPTLTALCIGPDEEAKIDAITGHLKLL